MSGATVAFAHDTEVGLAAAAALVNTTGPEGEQLPDPAALAEFLRRWEWTGVVRGDEAELAAIHRLRPELRRLWCGDADAVVAVVNRLLRDARALPQLVRHGDWPYHLHATDPDAPLADRMAVEAAMAFTDVIREQALDRLRVCQADDCIDVLVDLSKNSSRRFCDTACGNRMNVAAYRRRRSAG
jgi:predicted RNA-binding Zn ribbon-like protein